MSSRRKKQLLKIVMAGDAKVGKTSLLQRYVLRKFGAEYKATIGADFTTKEIQVDEVLISLQLWDTAGQDRFKPIAQFYTGADASILVFDLCVTSSFEHLEQHLQILQDNYDGSISPFPLLVFANKMDRAVAHSVSKERIDEWLANRGENTLYYEVSCKDESYAHVIDTAFVELVKLVTRSDSDGVYRQSQRKPGTQMNAEDGTEDVMLVSDDDDEYVKYRVDPAAKRIDRGGQRTCGPNANMRMCAGPGAADSDAFCLIL